MDFLELINIAQTNEYFASIASDLFRRKITQRTIKIEAKPDDVEPDIVINHQGDVTIRNVEMGSTLLELFGQSITKLKVLYERIDLTHAAELMYNINKYCSETLRDLSITGCNDSLCAVNRKPFIKVEIVSLNGFINTSDKIQLNETFPNLRQLSLKYIKISDPNCFAHKFPHLTEMTIDFSQSEFMYHNTFQHLFEKNPQIQKMSIQYASQNFLIIINKYLTNLKSLHIKSIIWNYFTSENWIDDVVRNEHLTDLYLTEDVFDSQFIKLAEAFPNLEKIAIKCDKHVSRDTVLIFVKELKNLKQLSLKTFNQKLPISLKMNLENEWNIEYIYSPRDPIVINIESK